MTKDPREVSPLSRGVISPKGSTPIRPITGQRSLSPSSSTRRPIGDRLAAGLPRREDDGLTTFHGRTTDGLGSACSPVARQRRQGKGDAPAPGHIPFWFKPVSILGLLVLTTFIGSSPELAMPSTLVPDRLDAGSRRVPSREARPPGSGEDTLSQELRTAGLLRPHVLVGYQWSHTGFGPGDKPVRTGTSAASCHSPPRTGLTGFRVPGSPVIRSQEFSILACRLPYSLPPDRPVPLRHVSGFPGPGLLRGLRRPRARARRRSRVFRSSYVRAWVRPSTHPYARDHLPVSHRTGLPVQKTNTSACGDAALSQRSGGAAYIPIGIGLEAV